MENFEKSNVEERFEQHKNSIIESLEKKLREIENLLDDKVVQLFETPWLGIEDPEHNPAKIRNISAKELKAVLVKEIDLAKNAKESKDLDSIEEYGGLLDYHAIKVIE